LASLICRAIDGVSSALRSVLAQSLPPAGKFFIPFGRCNRMTQPNQTIPQPRNPVTLFAEDTRPNSIARIGRQPIAFAAVILLVILAGAASITLWRSYSAAAPELDRVVAARQFQARAVQVASEQLAEKTRGLEVSQQESIDQLQVVQDQLQALRRQLAAQQADSKRLSDQVSALSEAVDSLRQSFASAQASESSAPAARNRSIRTRAVRYQKRAKSNS
jgi:uncharacterized coiled-coil protein SlyX